MQTSLTYLEQDASGNAALRIKIPASDARTPTHFMTLLDVSESMLGDNKLGNVKRCMSLLLKFLVPEDKLSIVTFGEDSKIVVKHAKAEAGSIPMLEQAIESLAVNGCTNLSAGLASIREILGECGDCHLKPSLLVLTDGHANRGAHTSPELQAIIKRIHELFPAVSMNFIAYGTDHNADLMKALSEETLGTYSIVSGIEGAALTMGEALGGAISCVAQNVVIHAPEGTTVEGPFKVVNGCITIGDVYAGSEKLLLLKKPEGPVYLAGTSLPDLDQFKNEVTTSTDTARNAEIDLTRLRYECSRLFHALRTERASNVNLASFRASLDDPFLAGNPVTDMLRAELASLEAAQEHLRHGMSRHIYSQLVQHETYTSVGGGTSGGILPPTGSPGAPDPLALSGSGDPGAPRVMYDDSSQTPMVSVTQRRVAQQMRTASLTPAP